MPKSEKLALKLELRLPFKNKDIAQAVNNATAPENIEAPPTITLASHVEEDQLVIQFDAKESIKDLISTLDDYFEKIALSIKTIEALE